MFKKQMITLGFAMFTVFISSIGLSQPSRIHADSRLININTSRVSNDIPKPGSFLDARYLRVINLTGISILDSNGENAFPFKTSLIKRPSQQLLQELLKQTGDDLIVSGVYSAQSSSFKYIYVFISQEIGDSNTVDFKLNTLFISNSNNSFLVNYKIVGTSLRQLLVENGPADEIENYIVQTGSALFPY